MILLNSDLVGYITFYIQPFINNMWINIVVVISITYYFYTEIDTYRIIIKKLFDKLNI